MICRDEDWLRRNGSGTAKKTRDGVLVEERGGQGIFQGPGILAKHLFGTLITALMNLVIFHVILIIGLILIGTQNAGSLFFQNPFIYFGLQLLFGVAVSSIVIAVCERSRNWDYNGIDYILLITDTGIGFAVFCAAAKNSNQRILDIEPNGGLPYRSISVGIPVTWDCHAGCMDAVVFDVKRCTHQKSRY